VSNFGDKKHKLTRSERSKGGKTVSPYRRLKLQLTNRVKCNEQCPLFPCAFEPLSRIKYGNECALKRQPPEIMNRFYKLYSCGEKEFIEEVNNALIRLSIKAGEDKFINMAEKVHKMRFGDKNRTELTGDDKTPVILQIQEALKVKRTEEDD
jgi:hypothetical protein